MEFFQGGIFGVYLYVSPVDVHGADRRGSQVKLKPPVAVIAAIQSIIAVESPIIINLMN